MQRFILWLIRCYQHSLSPDHGWGRALYPSAGCRFYPSCSEYARQAVEGRGVLRGVTMAARRLVRCHPWAEGGFDPVV